jgi:hypothetical protein
MKKLKKENPTKAPLPGVKKKRATPVGGVKKSVGSKGNKG